MGLKRAQSSDLSQREQIPCSAHAKCGSWQRFRRHASIAVYEIAFHSQDYRKLMRVAG